MMKFFPSRFDVWGALVATVIALAPGASSAQTVAPFTGLAGIWNGNGSISLAGGSSERIKCRATYAVGDNGNGLQQILRCASDSYRFELTSNIHNADGKITGTWAETTRNVSGNVEGRAGKGLFQVIVTSPLFTANVDLVTRGNSQIVKITSQGTEFSGAAITLTRS
jgi:hypothetical protein